jgi:hypothetical protein
MGNREMLYDKDAKCVNCGALGAHDIMGDYLCNGCVGFTEPENVMIPKVGLDAYTELGESHEAHINQIKKLEEELIFYKRLDCEGIDLTDDNGKIMYLEESQHSDPLFYKQDILELIKWIQDTQSEMDLGIKSAKEILKEYYADSSD